MYSVIHEDKVLDYHYTKQPNGYNFYLVKGDTKLFIGQIFKMRKNNWKAISWMKRGSMGGFGNRFYATEFLLVLNDFVRDEYSPLQEKSEEGQKCMELLNKIKNGGFNHDSR